jgi:hypothetical protein
MISQSRLIGGWFQFLLPALRLATRLDRSFLDTAVPVRLVTE